MLTLKELIHATFLLNENKLNNQYINDIIKFLYARSYNSFQVINEYDTKININNNCDIIVPSELVYAFIRNVAPKEDIFNECVEIFLEDNNLEILNEDEISVNYKNFGAYLLENDYYDLSKEYLKFRNKILNEEILNIDYIDRINTFLDYININEVYIDEEFVYNNVDENDILYNSNVGTFNNLNYLSESILNEGIGDYIIPSLLTTVAGTGLVMALGKSLTGKNEEDEKSSEHRWWNGAKKLAKGTGNAIFDILGGMGEDEEYTTINNNNNQNTPPTQQTTSGSATQAQGTPNNTSPVSNGSSGQSTVSGTSTLPRVSNSTTQRQSTTPVPRTSKHTSAASKIKNWWKSMHDRLNSFLYNIPYTNEKTLERAFSEVDQASREDTIEKVKRLAALNVIFNQNFDKFNSNPKLRQKLQSQINKITADGNVKNVLATVIDPKKDKNRTKGDLYEKLFKKRKALADKLMNKVKDKTATEKDKAVLFRLMHADNNALLNNKRMENKINKLKPEQNIPQFLFFKSAPVYTRPERKKSKPIIAPAGNKNMDTSRDMNFRSSGRLRNRKSA